MATVTPMFGRILEQIYGLKARWHREGRVLKELCLHSKNPFGNTIWIPFSDLFAFDTILAVSKSVASHYILFTVKYIDSSSCLCFLSSFKVDKLLSSLKSTKSSIKGVKMFADALFSPGLCPWLSVPSLSQVTNMPSPCSPHWRNVSVFPCPVQR